MLNESVKPVNVLTEEELNNIKGHHKLIHQEYLQIERLVTSHRTLNLRNAKLVHENDELMADHNKEKKELLDIIQGFLIWEEMFPSLKNYNKTHLRQVDDDYEDYRKLVDVAKTKVKALEELNHE